MEKTVSIDFTNMTEHEQTVALLTAILGELDIRPRRKKTGVLALTTSWISSTGKEEGKRYS